MGNVCTGNYETQRFFNCVTCGLVETMVVCAPCSSACHEDHDVEFYKEVGGTCDCDERIQVVEKVSAIDHIIL